MQTRPMLRGRLRAAIASVGRRHRPEDERRGLRETWEARYASSDLSDRAWYLPTPPPQLVEFLSTHRVPDAWVIDLGAGPGVATAYLAERLPRCIGVDIATAAMLRARARARASGADPSFVVAAAPSLPFASSSTAFVFDRGCMHQLPEDDWGRHLTEIGRVLVPGGYAQLLEHTITPSVISSIVPPSLSVDRAESFQTSMEHPERRTMLHAILRKR
jgi:SAM-dependent methyltransferase